MYVTMFAGFTMGAAQVNVPHVAAVVVIFGVVVTMKQQSLLSHPPTAAHVFVCLLESGTHPRGHTYIEQVISVVVAGGVVVVTNAQQYWGVHPGAGQIFTPLLATCAQGALHV
jgi:hypothetical protein